MTWLAIRGVPKQRLSCHFLIDVCGTVYQTLDVVERAWHATSANDSSVGVELAADGAFSPGHPRVQDWLRQEETSHGVGPVTCWEPAMYS